MSAERIPRIEARCAKPVVVIVRHGSAAQYDGRLNTRRKVTGWRRSISKRRPRLRNGDKANSSKPEQRGNGSATQFPIRADYPPVHAEIGTQIEYRQAVDEHRH